MAALLPLRSSSGAATTTSTPWSASARASTARPGARTPSSLVTRTRTQPRSLTGCLVLLGQTEVPLEDEVLPLGVAHNALTVAAELRVVGRQQHQPGQRPLAELLDERSFAEVRLHVP